MLAYAFLEVSGSLRHLMDRLGLEAAYLFQGFLHLSKVLPVIDEEDVNVGGIFSFCQHRAKEHGSMRTLLERAEVFSLDLRIFREIIAEHDEFHHLAATGTFPVRPIVDRVSYALRHNGVNLF